MSDLTPRQRSIVEFIATFTKQNGYPPTVRELGAAVGLRSTASVHAQLRNLEAKRAISRGFAVKAGKPRTVKVMP